MFPKLLTTRLTEELARGNKAAWERVYDVYAPLLYGVICRQVPPEKAPDVLQQVFIDMYTRAREYNGENENLFTWMNRLTVERCLAFTPEVAPEVFNQAAIGFAGA